jgi:hypothetical protein
VPLRPTAFFYLGLLPVIILLWAWADSVRMSTGWSRTAPGGQPVWISLGNSQFVVGRTLRSFEDPHWRPAPTPPLGRFRRNEVLYRAPGRSSMPLFPSLWTDPEEDSYRWAEYHFQRRHLPVWFLLACYAVPWLALSYYYARRRKARTLAGFTGSSHTD